MYVVWYFSHEREKLTPVPINHSHSISISTATLGTTHENIYSSDLKIISPFLLLIKPYHVITCFYFPTSGMCLKKTMCSALIAVGGGTLKVEELETHGSIYPCLHRDRLWS